MALFKYIVLSVCLCGIHLNGFAQSTREAILEDIARTGGVYYAYPVKEAIATPPPKGYKPFYISHYARHGSRWIQSEQDYKTVVDIFEKAHQAGVLTALGEDVRKRMALVWEDAEENCKLAEENLDLNTFSYTEGKLTILDVLSAQLTWIQAYTNLIQSYYEQKIALADYRKATGIRYLGQK